MVHIRMYGGICAYGMHPHMVHILPHGTHLQMVPIITCGITLHILPHGTHVAFAHVVRILAHGMPCSHILRLAQLGITQQISIRFGNFLLVI